jgi:hypothetical protein
MKLLRHPLFILAVLLFLTNQWLEYSGIYIPLLFSYLDDLLVMPIVLTLTLLFQRSVTYRNQAYVFSPWHVVVAIVYFALVFEVVLPRYSERYTADPFDVLAYTAGGFLFYTFINQPATSRNS